MYRLSPAHSRRAGGMCPGCRRNCRCCPASARVGRIAAGRPARNAATASSPCEPQHIEREEKLRTEAELRQRSIASYACPPGRHCDRSLAQYSCRHITRKGIVTVAPPISQVSKVYQKHPPPWQVQSAGSWRHGPCLEHRRAWRIRPDRRDAGAARA